MDRLTIGDIVHNSLQRAIVRWLGSIEETPIIGLQSIDLILPGYTDGTCPFNNKRYFDCPHGQGYYILRNTFAEFYEIISKKTETNKSTVSDDEFDSAEQSLSTSPAHVLISPKPISSSFSPSTSQDQHSSDNNHVTSPSRGILSRLAFEREQRKVRVSPSLTLNTNPFIDTSSVESDIPSRIYRPENYRSTLYDDNDEPEVYEFTAHGNDDQNRNNSPILQLTNNQLSSDHDLASFGHEYFLDTWTLGRVKSLLENGISIDNQLCLNIYIDQCNVQNLIDEQINGCLSMIPRQPPNDVRIELMKVFDHVKIIFPTRAIRLYDNDYLLLAILCSNNQCAYVRTTTGWAYTDDMNDNGQSFVVDEISEMIDGINSDILPNSEQCRHVLKNAAFLYYKLVE